MTAPSVDPARVPSEVQMPAHRRPDHTIVGLHDHLPDVPRHGGRLLIVGVGEASSRDEAGPAVLTTPHPQAEIAA
ncbi:hypothetical protein [Actinomadura nitritigenes]|uniref:hypothetical protein n=1 Tax=Actinomadura nitritigenes TaxID=134602 RepID=UPI003D8CC08C